MFLLFVLSGTPNDAGFLLDAWKALSGYPDLQKYILSSAIKFVSVRSIILGELESSKLQGLKYTFPENFRCNLTFYKVRIIF